MNNCCPICKSSIAFIEGERVDIGFGPLNGPKCGPDYCEDCGYVANHIEAIKKMLNEPDPVKEKESCDSVSIEIVSIPIEASPRKLRAKLDDKFVFLPYVPKKRTT